MTRPRFGSLATRMVLLFGALLLAIGVFMVVFFPARMDDRARARAQERATSIARVVATAVAPALEFDDPENAAGILGWLEATTDARFGIVRGAAGQRFASWHAERAPADEVLDAAPIASVGDLLVVTLPVAGLAGGQGTLHVGFSLAPLEAERASAERTVAVASGLVFSIGLLATLLVAALLVRPIRQLTRTARKITSGELPPELPNVEGADEISVLADELRQMLGRIHEQGQQELVRASRQAGMAEVATGVLHNVGNVLTSVNVASELLRERVDALPVDRLRRLHELLGQTPTIDTERLTAVRRFVHAVADDLEAKRAQAREDLGALRQHVDHIKRVVSMQNAYARLRSIREPARVASLLDEAIELGCPVHRRGDLEIGVDVDPSLAKGTVTIDRHRVLQILVNLVANARDAVNAVEGRRAIDIHASRDGEMLVLRVTDSGVGIDPAMMTRVFNAGFTSKPHGHGYGLHSATLSARELGGSLVATSDGVGRGATFTLRVPIEDSP